MDLNTYCEKIETAASLAKKMGVSPVEISNWRNRKRDVPPDKCVVIENKTGGNVTRKDLRPDDWQNFWPELVKSRKKTRHDS